MIKLLNLINEVSYKNEALAVIKEYFNECIDTFYPEYKSLIRNGEFVYPTFFVKDMSNKAGQCRLITNHLKTNSKIEIHIHSDFSNAGDTTKSVVFHETIHYIQFNLKLKRMEPYDKVLYKDDGHDKFFMSEMERMNNVLGDNFVKQTENKSAYLEGTRERFIYVIDYTDDNLQQIQKMYSNVRYGVAVSLRPDKAKLANFIRKYGSVGNVYLFKSKRIGWNQSVQLGSGLSYITIGSEKSKEIETAISSGLAELVNNVNIDYLYVYCVYNKLNQQFTAVYSTKPVPDIIEQVKNKYNGYGISNYLYFEFKTTNSIVTDLQKFIRNKSFKYLPRAEQRKFLMSVMNKEEPGIVDYKEIELKDMF